MIPFPTRPLLEVADILRAHGEAYCAGHPVSSLQAAVIRRLIACRTAALLYPLVLHHQRLLYYQLFQAASATLLTLSADAQRLGAQIGVTAILHTWGQNLLFHPHLHCVVMGGGLSLDGQRWVAGKRKYFLPVKVLGKMFRGKFLAGLKAAYQAGQVTLPGSVADLAD